MATKTEELAARRWVYSHRDCGCGDGTIEGPFCARCEKLVLDCLESERRRKKRRAVERDMLDAHLEGLHDGQPREGCPECKYQRR